KAEGAGNHAGGRSAGIAHSILRASTKFDLVIDLTTAKALGLGVPPNAARPRRRGDRVKGPIYFRGKRRQTRHGTKRTFSFWRSNLANAGLRLDALLRCLFLPNQEVFQNVFPVCGGQ